MDRAYQDHSQADPQQAGEPAERLAGEDRTGNRTGCSYSGKMLRKEIEHFRRDKVNAVVVGMSRSDPSVIQTDLSRNPSPVKAVGDHQQYQEGNSKERQGHSGSLTRFPDFCVTITRTGD